MKTALEDNIRVTVVEAGAVDTELATHITDEEALARNLGSDCM